MASLVPCEGSADLRALSRQEEQAGQGSPYIGLRPVSPLHTRMPTLTQEQVEDSSSHPARAERWNQAGELWLSVGLQLQCHRSVVVENH